eukprot:g61316.t1
MTNVQISLPELSDVLCVADIKETSDRGRGITMAFLSYVPVDMPKLKLVVVEDLDFTGTSYSAVSSIFGISMAENKQNVAPSFPSLKKIIVVGAAPSVSNGAILMQTVDHPMMHFAALTDIQISAGMAVNAFDYRFPGISMPALRSFRINNRLTGNSAYTYNGFVMGESNSAFTVSPALETFECYLEARGACFMIYFDKTGSNNTPSVELPSLTSITASVGGLPEVGPSSAYGLLLFGTSVQLDLRSLATVSVKADAALAVYGGPRQPGLILAAVTKYTSSPIP